MKEKISLIFENAGILYLTEERIQDLESCIKNYAKDLTEEEILDLLTFYQNQRSEEDLKQFYQDFYQDTPVYPLPVYELSLLAGLILLSIALSQQKSNLFVIALFQSFVASGQISPNHHIVTLILNQGQVISCKKRNTKPGKCTQDQYQKKSKELKTKISELLGHTEEGKSLKIEAEKLSFLSEDLDDLQTFHKNMMQEKSHLELLLTVYEEDSDILHWLQESCDCPFSVGYELASHLHFLSAPTSLLSLLQGKLGEQPWSVLELRPEMSHIMENIPQDYWKSVSKLSAFFHILPIHAEILEQTEGDLESKTRATWAESFFYECLLVKLLEHEETTEI